MDISFVPSLAVIGTFAVATIILAITPGPDMALFLARTMAQGRTHGLVSIGGALTGTLVHTFLVAFGISVLLAASPAGFLVLKICGALYLLWLAVDTLRHGTGLDMSTKKVAQGSLVQSFLKGLLINLLNPKIVLFFITFLPQFVDAGDPFVRGKLIFLGFEFVVISTPIVVAMVLGAHAFSSVLSRSVRLQKVLTYSFAGVFASFALTILGAEARS